MAVDPTEVRELLYDFEDIVDDPEADRRLLHAILLMEHAGCEIAWTTELAAEVRARPPPYELVTDIPIPADAAP